MKKAGIILGIFFIVIAILLCVFGLKYINKGETQDPNTEVVENIDNSANTEVQNPPVEQTPVIEQQPIVEQTPVVQQPTTETQTQTPNVEVVEKVITKEVSGVMTIDESGLGEPIMTKEVIVHITNKRIMMIDEDTDSTEPKMLTYCFDVLTPENMKLTLFVTNIVYTEYNVGDMLKVKYQVYQNNKGIQFPLVLNVTSVQ